MIRSQPAETAEALWVLLREKTEAQTGLSAAEAACDLQTGEGYARVRMRAWEKAGFAVYQPPKTTKRDDAGRFFMTQHAPKKSPVIRHTGEIEPREAAMSPAEFAVIRRKLGLSLAQIARALGRTGLQPTLTRAMRRFEKGETPIDFATAQKLRDLIKH
jgi:hypothetical protein